MLRVVWRNLVARRLRLLLSAFAIVLGVSFVAGSLIFTNAIGAVFDGIIEDSTSDVEVAFKGAGDLGSAEDNRVFGPDVVEKVAALPEVENAYPSLASQSMFVIGANDKVVGGNGPPGIGTVASEASSVNGQRIFRLRDGRFPTGPEEVALESSTAERGGIEVGDEVEFVTPGDPPTITVEVVGTFAFGEGGLNGATLAVFDKDYLQGLLVGGRDVYQQISVDVADGVSRPEAAAAIEEVLPETGLRARAGDEVIEDNRKELDRILGFLNTFLLVFAAVSLVVGSFLIVNTFTILVAQRSRELALLRALGASRRQVNRAAVAEALGVGFLGGTLGLLGGWLLARGLAALFKAFGADFTNASFDLTWQAVVASYVVGVVVTAVASIAPARRASRIAPVAALRDDVALPESTLRRRLLVGSVLIAAGVASMAWGLLDLGGDVIVEIAGGMLGVLVGVALVSPVFARPVIAVFDVLYRPFGTIGRLAAENSRRNPRRTAATASALMVGLALMTMMSIFGASASASTDETIKNSYRSQLVVSNAVGTPFSTSVAERARKVEGVRTVASLRYGQAKVKGAGTEFLIGVDPDDYADVIDIPFVAGSIGALGPGKVLLAQKLAAKLGVGPGDPLPVTFQAGSQTLRVAGIFPDGVGIQAGMVVTHATLEKGGIAPLDSMVFVVTESTDAVPAVSEEIEKIVADLPTVTLQSAQGFADSQREQTDQFLTFVNVLLALSVLIGVLGVVNTLALSVIERTREVGLLRAIGTSRRQLRRLVRLEAVAIAVFGALLGVTMGIAFGVGLVRALRDEGITVLEVPVPTLLVFVLASVVLGVLAAVLPARRAARLPVLQAISTE